MTLLPRTAALLPLLAPLAAQDSPGFNAEIRPLLADRCFACHGPDQAERKAGLRLDERAGSEGATRVRAGAAAIVPGDPEASELWFRLTTDDAGEVMPPRDSHKEALTAQELDLVRRWIEAGAPYEEFWSFAAPEAPALPEVGGREWCRQPLDSFVLAGLAAEGLAPSPAADRRTLLRRVCLDLTGLPPTREEIAGFLADESPQAYERQVDRLLADPAHAEHMTRYWLDLVRFADTNGVHHDHYREMSPYRDWVIRAFEDNLPYDRFVTDQLAGDLVADPTTDQLIASGWHRLHMIIDRGTALPEESLHRNVIDRTTAFGTAFLGLTVQCAVCHDHKYDPISQREFYGLSAFFNNFAGDPETGSSQQDKLRGLQPPYLELPDAAQAAELARTEAALDEAEAKLAELEKLLGEAEEEAKAERTTARDAARKVRDEAKHAFHGVQRAVPAAMVMREREERRPAFLLERGNYERPLEEVPRGTPAFLPALVLSGEEPSRLDLARWLVSGDHPLTARVAVNRAWQQLFGVGLVKTAEDFGTQGEWPRHLALLDHLAVEFQDSGWDVQALLRRLVLSATYRQSSAATPERFAADPENRLLGRGSRFRLDAEVLRDQILFTSGLLNPERFGPSVKPPQPAGVWEAVTLPSSYPRHYQADTGDQTRRRSVYTFWKRGMPPVQMSLLGAPTREECTARRERTNTPLQALLFMNEPEYLKAARHLARTALSGPTLEDGARLALLHETVTGRLPDESRARVLRTLLGDLRHYYDEVPELAAALCSDIEAPEGTTQTELSAWTLVVHTLYGLDETKTHE